MMYVFLYICVCVCGCVCVFKMVSFRDYIYWYERIKMEILVKYLNVLLIYYYLGILKYSEVI